MIAAKYRSDDEIEITTDHHRHLKEILSTITSSFGRPVSALDLGCGTGRYFHCLNNITHLTGIDICEEMLRIAENPVRQGDITIKDVQLRCANAHLVSFPSRSFDFIYSLGMFGNGCPVTVEICNNFYDWLKPGGKLFFDAVDILTLPRARRIRRRIRKTIYPFLPKTLQISLDMREGNVPFCGLSKSELLRIMRASHFKSFSATSQKCISPLWRGYHLECTASKPVR
ncbi:class I SAM-dependent methyltransferase [Pedosphaera parvula]|uniref:Methyltransferase type 11 n=1 Tax=Pedosphaera parvula (strain Ellin514) TaxID=320771 RepID=B9X9R3_PEDPL|nr:class I SAM-dependent methyltransferase [Pedosphaera parvula]EEF63211.1 Methyltransferase type 11 [Pedosphaera parvula Ellin514]